MAGRKVGERLGMLGGTFDPPHIGHAIIARDLVERLELDRLLLIPAAQPPHREHSLPAGLRYELVRDMVADMPALEVSDIELKRPGPSYTVETLLALRSELRPDRLFCIIGADQLAVIDTWHDYRRIPELAELAVMRRDGREPSPPEGAGIPYITVDVTRVDVSSTRVRRRLRRGQSIQHLVPETIRARIESAWREQVPGGSETAESEPTKPETMVR